TCQALRLHSSCAIADPAVLLGSEIPRLSTTDSRVAFVPHIGTRERFDCERLAEMAGLRLIDPAGPVEDVLRSIASSPVVLVESMHGAILADSIGVPWQRISLFNRRLEGQNAVDFKWQDWGASLELDTTPTMEYMLPWPGRSPVRRFVKRLFVERSLRKAAQALRSIMNTGHYQLSQRELLRCKANQIREAIDAAKSSTKKKYDGQHAHEAV
ncbi:MAG TPA: hypothetical protein VHP11_16320, partial [Tepidisphaeraceae bacterium]|nr:hypothetical protein [Tepidisphaeraceae bacterium]